MIRFLIVHILIACFGPSHGQDYRSYRKVLKELGTFENKDSLKAQSKVERWWNQRKKAGQIPLVAGDSVTFLYRGTATSVDWAGDFNGWGSKPFNNKGKRISNTSIWILSASFPATSRLDYKVIINGKDWILDPDNPNYQYAGVGGGTPNSELRMPGWKRDPAQEERKDVAKGALKAESILSKSMGYELRYLVYTPAGTPAETRLPVLYVTDGSEYLDARLGNMPLVLDNLVYRKTMRIKVVFVDARDPANLSVNRRMQELALNENYLRFFTEELIPAVEGADATANSTHRGILGTSLGGLNAAYFSFKRPDLFPRCAIQSPAFWYKPEIFDLAAANTANIQVFMTSGTINDTSNEARQMKGIFDRQGNKCGYVEVSEGHSWGNWRNLLDDILVALYGAQ